jgi:hypothetical protein
LIFASKLDNFQQNVPKIALLPGHVGKDFASLRHKMQDRSPHNPECSSLVRRLPGVPCWTGKLPPRYAVQRADKPIADLKIRKGRSVRLTAPIDALAHPGRLGAPATFQGLVSLFLEVVQYLSSIVFHYLSKG